MSCVIGRNYTDGVARSQESYRIIPPSGCAYSRNRYCTAVCLGCRTENVAGSPDPKRISTSYVERQNLTKRISMRRFTRVTNAFSMNVDSDIARHASDGGRCGKSRLVG